LIFSAYIPDNIANWRVFNDDVDIPSFLIAKGTYTNQIIDEDEHDKKLKTSLDENSFPKPVVTLEDM